jgi:hypothetical protein
MPRKAKGPRPLTAAERQARRRQRKAGEVERMRNALERITKAKTVREAREIAASALVS